MRKRRKSTQEFRRSPAYDVDCYVVFVWSLMYVRRAAEIAAGKAVEDFFRRASTPPQTKIVNFGNQ